MYSIISVACLALLVSVCQTSQVLLGSEWCQLDSTLLTCSSRLREWQVFPPPRNFLSPKVSFQTVSFSDKYYSEIPDYSFEGLSISIIMFVRNKINQIGDYAFKGIRNLVTLSISGNKLISARFYDIFSLEKLELSSNEFQEIDHNMFVNLPELKYLDLSNNQIIFINKDAFFGLKSLINLDLSSNNLFDINFKSNSLIQLYLSTNRLNSIEMNSFKGLGSLKELDLSYNQIRCIEDYALASTLPNLTFLDLSENDLSDKSINNFTFVDMRNLKSLLLSNNKLTYLKSSYFKDLDQLIVFSVYQNELARFDLDLFMKFPHISIVDLANNCITSEHFGHFPDTLTEFRMDRNMIDRIEQKDMKNLSNLKTLWLDSNKISYIEDYSFQELTRLTELSLDDQRLVNITENMFYGLGKLNTLYLAHNQIQFISPKAFSQLKNLTELDLSNNKLESLNVESFEGLIKLKNISLSNNKLTKLEDDRFVDLKSLKSLWLTNNLIREISSHAFLGLNRSLFYLYLDHNRLEFIRAGYFNHLTSLIALVLTRNQMSMIEPGSFDGLESLQYLYLDDNCLVHLEYSVFNRVKGLGMLNLQQNTFKQIEKRWFEPIKAELMFLRLDFNQITEIKRGIFAGMIFLFEVSLKNNLIRLVDMNAFADLPNLGWLLLDNNPIQIVVPLIDKSILTKLISLSVRNTNILLIEQFNHILLELNFLDLSDNTQITKQMYQNLSSSKVTVFLLSNLSYTAQDLNDFGPRVKTLDLSRSRVKFESQNQLISECKSLSTLNVSNLNIDNFEETLDLSLFDMLLEIDLSFNKLNKIGQSYFKYNLIIIGIYLSHNLIEFIESESFSNNNDLRNLDLSHNRLKNIERDVFGLNRLSSFDGTLNLGFNQMAKFNIYFVTKELYFPYAILLMNNNLTEFPIIEGNSIEHVLTLDLSMNRITKIPRYRSCRLTSLALSNNMINQIDTGALSCMSSLTLLDLSFNQLKNLTNDPFNSQFDLRRLNLSHNQLEVLDGQIFNQLVDLEYLDLSYNQIYCLGYRIFQNQTNLKHLDLKSNQLRTVFNQYILSGLERLKFLFISNNPDLDLSSLDSVKEIFHPRVAKTSGLDVVYYTSVSIVTLDLNDAFDDLNCQQTLYLARFNIQFNLYLDDQVEQLISRCDTWLADNYHSF